MNETITYRFMQLEDIDQILDIEKKSFLTPWSREAFVNELTKNQFAVYIVLEVDNMVIGYCGAWLVVDEAHITNVAILPEYRGKHYGEAIMKRLIETARERGAKTMTLEVRVTNNVAQALYRKLGFQDGAIRKGYYTDSMEDALVMWVNL